MANIKPLPQPLSKVILRAALRTTMLETCHPLWVRNSREGGLENVAIQFYNEDQIFKNPYGKEIPTHLETNFGKQKYFHPSGGGRQYVSHTEHYPQHSSEHAGLTMGLEDRGFCPVEDTSQCPGSTWRYPNNFPPHIFDCVSISFQS